MADVTREQYFIPGIYSDQSIATAGAAQGPIGSNQTMYPPASSTMQQNAVNRYQSNRQILTLSSSQQVPKYYFVISLYDYSPQVGGQPGTVSSNSGNYGIGNFNGLNILPLPQNLVDDQVVDYSEEPLGPLLGGVIQNNAGLIQQGIGQAFGGDLSGALSTGSQILSGTSGGTAAKGAGVDLFQSAFPTITAAGGAVMGAAVNQFRTVLLKGPAYKMHTFDFFLAPKNATESENIRLIIRRLRAAMAPTLSSSRIFWLWPQVVICTFWPQQNDPLNTKMYAFKPAVITNIGAAYAPGGAVAFYKEQYPEAISMRITLKEIEYWLSSDYGGRDNGGGI